MLHAVSGKIEREGDNIPLKVGKSNKHSYVPTVGLGVFLIFKISGRGIIDPDASIPLDTLTLVPSSRYLTPTLQGFLHQ